MHNASSVVLYLKFDGSCNTGTTPEAGNMTTRSPGSQTKTEKLPWLLLTALKPEVTKPTPALGKSSAQNLDMLFPFSSLQLTVCNNEGAATFLDISMNPLRSPAESSVVFMASQRSCNGTQCGGYLKRVTSKMSTISCPAW
jgi:hypothetical protein